jgi:hypothetical protein
LPVAQEKITSSEKYCQRVVGGFVGFDGQKLLSASLRCNQWTCPACRERLKKQVRSRVLHGPIAQEATSKYELKFLTLTYGGTEARQKHVIETESGIKYNAKGMYDEMIHGFHKLIRALKKVHGSFKYFRVTETHKDGVPHFHVLLVGKAIAKKSILDHITDLWRNRYGFGFVKLNTPKAKTGKTHFNNVKHALNYMLKYLTKDVLSCGPYKRVFSASQKSMNPKEKGDFMIYEVAFGNTTEKGTSEEVLYDSRRDKLTPAEMRTLEYTIKKRLAAMMMPGKEGQNVVLD